MLWNEIHMFYKTEGPTHSDTLMFAGDVSWQVTVVLAMLRRGEGGSSITLGWIISRQLLALKS